MPLPTDTSRPRLAPGCRWGGTEDDRVILFPEGAIKLQGTGRTTREIVEFLQKNPEKWK